jgi:hypothetical protein
MACSRSLSVSLGSMPSLMARITIALPGDPIVARGYSRCAGPSLPCPASRARDTFIDRSPLDVETPRGSDEEGPVTPVGLAWRASLGISVSVICAACHLGTGPVVAVGRRGISWGWEGGFGIGPVRGDFGQSWSSDTHDGWREFDYGGVSGFWPLDGSRENHVRLLGGGTLGGGCADGDCGAVLAAWPAAWLYLIGPSEVGCDPANWLVGSLSLGVRFMDDEIELFAAPRASLVFASLLCD